NKDGNVEEEFQMDKGWAFPDNSKFGKKGGERIKKKVIELLKQFFLNGNVNSENSKIEEKNVPKMGTIQNWIGRYSHEFNCKGTFVALQNFNTEDSSN
ncbi:10575_t:CDS:2, partial [Gigaspora margarita]